MQRIRFLIQGLLEQGLSVQLEFDRSPGTWDKHGAVYFLYDHEMVCKAENYQHNRNLYDRDIVADELVETVVEHVKKMQKAPANDETASEESSSSGEKKSGMFSVFRRRSEA